MTVQCVMMLLLYGAYSTLQDQSVWMLRATNASQKLRVMLVALAAKLMTGRCLINSCGVEDWLPHFQHPVGALSDGDDSGHFPDDDKACSSAARSHVSAVSKSGSI